jgi:hypothetical protein
MVSYSQADESFFFSDSDSKGMRTTASSIQEAAGSPGIDYPSIIVRSDVSGQIMSPNGTPAGNNMKDNADGWI